MQANEGIMTGVERREIRSLSMRLERLVNSSGDWAWDVGRGTVRFEPISPAQYAEKLLFRGIPKVLLLSATLRPESAKELGLEADVSNYTEMGSPFPVENRLVYSLELGFRVNAKTSHTNLLYHVNRIDQVMEKWPEQKGIIHAVSYERAKFIAEHSRNRKRLILHQPEELGRSVYAFKQSKEPYVLVSPAVHTGYDFPYDSARWQIIAKVPFPDCRQGIAAARKRLDDNYDKRIASQKLVQMVGRVTRASDDCGTTVVLDDSVRWLFKHYRMLFSRTFREAYREVSVLP